VFARFAPLVGFQFAYRSITFALKPFGFFKRRHPSTSIISAANISTKAACRYLQPILQTQQK
jgi:hypothetical protein